MHFQVEKNHKLGRAKAPVCRRTRAEGLWWGWIALLGAPWSLPQLFVSAAPSEKSSAANHRNSFWNVNKGPIKLNRAHSSFCRPAASLSDANSLQSLQSRLDLNQHPERVIPFPHHLSHQLSNASQSTKHFHVQILLYLQLLLCNTRSYIS